MSYELLQQEPEKFLALLLLSLLLTVLAYGSFPLIFSKTRSTPITGKRYKRICYGVNFAVLIIFVIINGGVANGAPYILWTSIFSSYGVKTLSSRGFMIEEPLIEIDEVCFCRKCGKKLIKNSRFCGNCGTEIVEAASDFEIDNCEFCKKCGADVSCDEDICHVCGEKKGEEEFCNPSKKEAKRQPK